MLVKQKNPILSCCHFDPPQPAIRASPEGSISKWQASGSMAAHAKAHSRSYPGTNLVSALWAL